MHAYIKCAGAAASVDLEIQTLRYCGWYAGGASPEMQGCRDMICLLHSGSDRGPAPAREADGHNTLENIRTAAQLRFQPVPPANQTNIDCEVWNSLGISNQ